MDYLEVEPVPLQKGGAVQFPFPHIISGEPMIWYPGPHW